MPKLKSGAVVLVVEDEWLIFDFVKEELEDAGCTVIAVSTGETAFEVLSDAHVDLVVTDIHLAGRVDGWAVAAKAREINPVVPVIYTTAYPPEPELQVEDGAFISKPYAPVEIVRAAKRLLDD